MKLKLRIFALMAMLLCFAFQANAQEIVNETGVRNALINGGEYYLGNDVTTTTAITTSGVTSVIDLNGKTLTIGAGDNQFCDASDITIKNGTISITGLTVGGNAVFRLDEYEKTLVTTLTLENVNLVGDDYSSAYCIFYIGRSSVLNVKGGVWSLENDKSTSGGVFKADDSAATLNIDGLDLTAHNVRRVVTYAATTIENSTLAISGDADGVDAEMEHGFNRSPLAISNSTITMTDMVGRGITAENGAVTIENSTVTMTNCQEATIDVRGGQTVTIDDASTVELDKEPTITGGTISGDVVLPVYVAQIGDVKYTDLREAMVAATASDIVIMLDNVDLAGTEWEPVAFKGTFDGKDKVIKNLTINKPDVANTGFITSLNGTFKNVTFTNPTVTGGENTAVVAGRAGGSAALAENITINGTIKVETTHTGYARAAAIVGGWGYGNYKNITVDGGDKAASYIKHSGGGDGRYVAGIVGHADDVQSYENCTVKNITISGGWLCGAIAGPGPADGLATGCVVENVDMGADYSGGMFGWYFGSGTIEDATIKNVTFIDGSTCNGAIGGYSNNTNANVSNVIIENVKNNDGAPLLNHVAKVGEVYYSDLQEAIKAAAPAGTVELLADVVVDEWVMFSETLSISNGDIITTQINGLTINGNGKTVTVKDVESAGNGGRLFYDATNLNINNLTFNFVDNAANLGGIGLTAGTIENVTFNGGGYAIFPGTGEVTIEGCTFKTNATSIYYEDARDNLVVTGNTFENPDNVNVILLRGNTTFTDNTVISGRTVNVVSGSPVVTGNDFNDVRFKVYNVATATIEENTINNLAFNDESVVNSTFENNILSEAAQAVFDAANFPVPVAKIGEVEYETLAAALAAAKDGETVTLLWAEGDPAIAMNAAVFGKNVTITGTATVDWSKGWFYVGRGGAGNATVTFDGANLTSASANENSGLGIHVSGREKDTNNKYYGTLVIKNSTIALDYLINRGAIELGEGAVLTVKNGFGIAGRPASETENGEAATATVTLNNGSKLVVNNHNGMGLGQAAINPEGYGVMNVNEGATFEATQNFLVTANGTMNVAAGGAVNVNGTLTVNGTLVCAGNIAATIAAGDAANIEISGGVYTQNVAEWCIDGYAALPDLNGNYVVGEEPTATVNNMGAMTIPGGEYSIYDGSYQEPTATDPDMPLSFVMQFLADQDADDMATSPYADWYGDFVLTFTGLENDSFSAEGCYLAGYYGSFGWVKVPVEGLLSTIKEGVRYPVMLGVDFGQKYDYICTGVKDFRCALYIPETVLEANPNIEVKLELSVVDNSKGQDAAAEALRNGTNIYEVGAYEYEAKDFNPGYLSEYTINDADAFDYTQAEDKKIGTLTYNRTLIEGIWNPLYLPFSVSLKDLADNYEVAYYNTMHSYDNDNNGTFETFEMEVLKLTANELNDVMLKANYPYFIRPKNADACALQIVETDATLFAAAEKVITTTSVSHTFQLKSTHKALDAAALTGCYAISTGGDWALTAGLKPHRLYLTISANDDSPYATTAAKTIRIVARGDEGFEGTTGVDIVETDNAADGTIYDLSGRPVVEPVKGGMYIINGKKVVY